MADAVLPRSPCELLTSKCSTAQAQLSGNWSHLRAGVLGPPAFDLYPREGRAFAVS